MLSGGTNRFVGIEQRPGCRFFRRHITVANVCLEVANLSVDVEGEAGGAFKRKDLSLDAQVIL